MVAEGDGYVKPVATTPLDREEWTHYAFVWDGERALLFVNGQLESEKPAPGALRDNGLPLFIGADTDGNGNPQNPFTGEIDDESLEVDEAATEARRQELREARAN